MSKKGTPAIRHVVFDADNTLYSWADMHLPALRAMAEFMSKQTGIPLPYVIGAMRRVYSKAGTLDYAPLVQEMELFEDMPKKELVDFVLGVREVYGRICDAHFQLYPGVKSGLRRLKQKGIHTYVMTDSPLLRVIHRLRRVGVDRYFDKIFGQRDEGNKLLPHYTQGRIGSWEEHLPMGSAELLQRKPNINLDGLLGLAPEEGPESVMVVGDDVEKDMGMALYNSCLGGLAQYGSFTPEQIRELRCFGAMESAVQSVELSADSVELIKDTRIKVFKRFSDLFKYL